MLQNNINSWFLLSFRGGILYALYVVGAILLAGALANVNSWAKAFSSLFFSQGRHMKRTMNSKDGAPLTALGVEVSIMTDMVAVSSHYLMLN